MKYKGQRFYVVFSTPGYDFHQLYCSQYYKLVCEGCRQKSVTFIFYLAEFVTFGDVSYLVAIFPLCKDRRVSVSFLPPEQED